MSLKTASENDTCPWEQGNANANGAGENDRDVVVWFYFLDLRLVGAFLGFLAAGCIGFFKESVHVLLAISEIGMGKYQVSDS